MGKDVPQERRTERVIRTPEDLAAALTELFLANADAGNDAANDELTAQLREQARQRRDS
ncbi:hypothetical protein [Prauserella sp. PE36]|uniref:hypothetical protein n=1 Tax=Prauserella sp. PE36 TaxID=1504709 RepID=UPI001314F4C0|nr:hypothetical protein [Prauserella sp. PE36]